MRALGLCVLELQTPSICAPDQAYVTACVLTDAGTEQNEYEGSPVLWITVPEALRERVARYLQLRDLK